MKWKEKERRSTTGLDTVTIPLLYILLPIFLKKGFQNPDINTPGKVKERDKRRCLFSLSFTSLSKPVKWCCYYSTLDWCKLSEMLSNFYSNVFHNLSSAFPTFLFHCHIKIILVWHDSSNGTGGTVLVLKCPASVPAVKHTFRFVKRESCLMSLSFYKKFH